MEMFEYDLSLRKMTIIDAEKLLIQRKSLELVK